MCVSENSRPQSVVRLNPSVHYPIAARKRHQNRLGVGHDLNTYACTFAANEDIVHFQRCSGGGFVCRRRACVFLTTRATAGLSSEIVLARACDGHAATIASPTHVANVVFGITCPAPRIQPLCSLEYRATRSGRRDRSAPALPQRPPVSHETRHPYRPQPASRDRSPHHRP